MAPSEYEHSSLTHPIYASGLFFFFLIFLTFEYLSNRQTNMTNTWPVWNGCMGWCSMNATVFSILLWISIFYSNTSKSNYLLRTPLHCASAGWHFTISDFYSSRLFAIMIVIRHSLNGMGVIWVNINECILPHSSFLSTLSLSVFNLQILYI